MTRAEILSFITIFDQLPENEKTYGDQVIRDYVRAWATQQADNDSPLQFSAFLSAHTGPRNFNAYLSSPENCRFMGLFDLWQQDCVIYVRTRVPAVMYQPGEFSESADTLDPTAPSQ